MQCYLLHRDSITNVKVGGRDRQGARDEEEILVSVRHLCGFFWWWWYLSFHIYPIISILQSSHYDRITLPFWFKNQTATFGSLGGKTFTRHPDFASMLLADAPALLTELLIGCIWRSRMAFHGLRRVNYYCKHLIIDPEGKCAHTLDWVIKEKDPKLVCHPVLALQSVRLWDRVASRVFVQKKGWSVLNLAICIVSQAVPSRQESTEVMRIVIAVCEHSSTV